MKRLLWLLPLLIFMPRAHATNCALTPGASMTTINAAYSAAGTGSCTGTASSTTVLWTAGNYSITGDITVPCGANTTGPAVTYSRGIYQTANLTGTLTNDWPFHYPGGGCTTAMTFQYIHWNGGMPSGGGGGMVFVPNTGQSNMTFSYNTCEGLLAQGSSGSDLESTECIWLDGYSTNGTTYSPVDSNVTITWNLFGSLTTLQCGAIMTLTTYHGGGYDSKGGYCGGVGIHTGVTNMTIEYNIFANVEQGLKGYEPTGGYFVSNANPCAGPLYCQNNLIFRYNDIFMNHRIGFENQGSPAQSIYYEYNDFHTWYYGQYGSWYISAPQIYNAVGGNPSGSHSGSYVSNVNANIDYNIFAEDAACVGSGCYFPGIEFWSTGTMNYNFSQGILLQFGDGYSTWSISNNTFQASGVGWEGCVDGNSPIACGSNPTVAPQGFDAPPTLSGNVGCTVSNGVCNSSTSTISALTSVAPTVSPVGGTVTSGTVVTISNTGTHRDTNTSAWCTTDGTTPVPGSGSATIMTSYTVTSNKTLKCVGMWGAANQPTSYASGYGYVPSSVISNSYTVSGGGGAVAPPGTQVIIISANSPLSANAVIQ